MYKRQNRSSPVLIGSAVTNIFAYSVIFDGSLNYLYTPVTSSVNFANSNFTVECWVYTTAYTTYTTIASVGVNGSSAFWALVINATGYVVFYTNTAGNFALPNSYTSTNIIPYYVWTHIAVVRSSATSFNIYINGLSSYSTSSFVNPVGATGNLYLGSYFTQASYGFYGYISNFRIVNLAVYTGSFTPQTNPLTLVQNAGNLTSNAITGTQTALLALQSTVTGDASTNNLTLTNTGGATLSLTISPFTTIPQVGGYSGYFNGSTYLTVTYSWPGLSAIHTIEAFVYMTSYPSPVGTIMGETNGGNTDAWEWTIQSNNVQIGYRSGPSTIAFVGASYAFSLNTWYHIAVSYTHLTLPTNREV